MSRPNPSFAQEASALLLANKPVDAARLCADGISYYPDYAGGYVVLARCYAAMGRETDAQVMWDEIQRRFPKHRIVAQKTLRTPAPVNEPTASNEQADSLKQQFTLRLVNTSELEPDQRIIRSASVRLIPGLEYTSLRFEGMRSRGRREIATLLDPPPFRSFHPMRKTVRPATTPPDTPRKPVSLEELAARLEQARIPNVKDQPPASPPATVSTGPTVVTETIANIYMQQGSYEKAIEAFEVLIERKPENRKRYEQYIKECSRALQPR